MNTYDCPNGCSDGVCKEAEAPTPVPETCSDTDGGDKPNQYGEVNWRSQVSKDNCFSAQTGEQSESCSGAEPFCRLAENYCNQVNVAVVRTYECANGCSQGACVGQPPTLPPAQPAYQCSDSDGGYNYIVKGTLIDKANHPHEDSCLGTQRLTEFACMTAFDNSSVYNPVNEYYKQNYECPYRCENGVCINPPATPTPTSIPASVSPTLMPLADSTSCFDSDGGRNYPVKGYTIPAITPTRVPTGSLPSDDKFAYSEEIVNGGRLDDICISENTLTEYYCRSDGKHIDMEDVNCEGECRDGACIGNVIPESRSRAGFSVSGQAEDAYQNVYNSNLMNNINTIYLEARKKYPNWEMKKINLVLSDFGLNLPNYFNASTNEIVLQKGNMPSQEDLTWLVMASLQKDLALLPIDKLNQEINKIPNKEVSRKAFPSDKGSVVSTVEPKKEELKSTSTPKNVPTISQSSSLGCTDNWTDYPKEKYSYKMKIPPGWTAETSPKIEETDSFSEIDIVSTTRPEEQMDSSFKISNFLIVASKKDIKTDENYQGMFENNSGNQKKSQVDFKGISAEKYVDETETACGGQVNQAVNCGHRFETYYFKKGDFYYMLSLGIYETPDLKEKNESTLNCFLDSFELPQK